MVKRSKRNVVVGLVRNGRNRQSSTTDLELEGMKGGGRGMGNGMAGK